MSGSRSDLLDLLLVDGQCSWIFSGGRKTKQTKKKGFGQVFPPKAIPNIIFVLHYPD